MEVPGLGPGALRHRLRRRLLRLCRRAADVGVTLHSPGFPPADREGHGHQARRHGRPADSPPVRAGPGLSLRHHLRRPAAWTTDAHSRNVCIFAEGEVDRSPTGTGVSGRLAIHHARGEIGLDERIVVESIIGSRFSGRVARDHRVRPLPGRHPGDGGHGSHHRPPGVPDRPGGPLSGWVHIAVD
ncbi:MAG: proline racemase family protein [Desulfobacterales bacterium]|nr:proline racemase family protein [Desulfobacterales bacterium]